jgi:hypothetical protein
MKFDADRTFFEQARAFHLRFTCEDCAYLELETGKCVHGYPNEEHRRAHVESSPRWIIPCKDFELA